MKHFLGVMMVRSLPENNQIWISLCRPKHASISYYCTTQGPQFPHTNKKEVTIIILNRNYIYLTTNPSYLLAHCITTFFPNTILLGCNIPLFSFSMLQPTKTCIRLPMREMQLRASSAWCPLFQSKVRVQRLND